MKTEKYYFEKSDSEICYSKKYFDYLMEENGITEIRVYEALKDRTMNVFWCRAQCFCGDDSKDTCGKQCREYSPRNGKSGCCKHYTTTLYTHGEQITIKL